MIADKQTPEEIPKKKKPPVKPLPLDRAPSKKDTTSSTGPRPKPEKGKQ